MKEGVPVKVPLSLHRQDERVGPVVRPHGAYAADSSSHPPKTEEGTYGSYTAAR